MATITKIRQKSGLVLIVIGLGMGAFILGDFFRGGTGGAQNLEVGSVNGETIDRLDYETRVSDEIDAMRSVNQNPSSQQSEQIRSRIWNEILQDKTVGEQAASAGFNVTQGEYDDIRWGDNVNAVFLNDPSFSPEGRFDPNLVKNYFNAITTNYPLYAKLQQNQLIRGQKYDKYYTAITRGLDANDLEAVAVAESNDSKMSFNFVLKRYNSIADSTVVVSDQDIRAYYNEHKNEDQYKQVASRAIKYVTFRVEASESDKSIINNQLDLLVNDFKNTDNDSLYVLNNSDNKTTFDQIYTPGTFPAEYDSLTVNGAIGEMVGPFENGAYFALVKVTGDHYEKEARVRHILLRTNGVNDDEIEARADSILRVIKRKRNFEDMVNEFSDDVASVKDGGVYDWFPQGRMVKEFNDFSFNGRIGEIKVVKTNYGFHIVEVLGQREERQAMISMVTKVTEPSNETYDEVYSTASDFSINNADVASFEASAAEANLTVSQATRVLKTAKGVPGMANSEELVRWTNGASLEEVSTPIEIDDQFVVAILTKISEEGTPKFEDVKDRFKTMVVLDKKVEMLSSEMEGQNDLEALASGLNLQVQTASNIPFSSNNIPGGGSNEMEVIGKAFSLNEGDVSIPMKGEAGVYVVEVTSKQAVAVEELDPQLFMVDAQKNYANRVNSGVFSALRNDADIVDNRTSF